MNPVIRLRVLPQLLPTDGREIELQATPTFIQWRYVTDFTGEYAWNNLIAVVDLVGPAGPAIELRSNGTMIQYRSIGSVDWVDIIPLLDLTGDQGPPGEQGIPGIQGPPGPGDVNGPTSATPDAVALWSGTSGELLKDSLRLIQTSADDNTIGRLMGVGAFGIGGAGLVSSDANLNNYIVPGTYVTPSAPTGGPAWFTGGGRLVLVVGGGTAHISHLLLDPFTGEMATRGINPGGATAWMPVTPTGSVINSWSAAYTTLSTATALIPTDDTIPTSSEGLQILSVTTGALKSATSKLRCRFIGSVGASATGAVIASIFVGGAAAVRSSIAVSDLNRPLFIPCEHEYTPGSTSPVTVTVRVGTQAGNLGLNSVSGSRFLGGTTALTLIVEEIK